MAEEQRKVFTFLRSFYEAAKAIDDKEVQADYLMAVIGYGLDDCEPELTGYAKMAFCLAKPNIDANKKRSARRKSEVAPESIPSNPEETSESPVSYSEVTSELLTSNSIITHNSLTHNSLAHKSSSHSPKSEKEERVQFAENVAMTNGEYKKLLAAHGEADTLRLIEILDNYKGSTGKKYKSDYRAILSWVVDRMEEEKRKKTHSTSGGNSILDLLEEGVFDD